jgi:excisionase family DNA binding protein
MNESSCYLTAKQLAQRWQVTQRTVINLALSGRLRGIRIGRLWRFRPQDVDAWEHRQEIDEDQVKDFVRTITS